MCMMPGTTPSAMHRWGMQHRCQLGVACFVGVQNNGNVKSEPKYLTCDQYVLSTSELFLVLLSLSWFLGEQTSLLSFLRVASRQLHSAFVYVLGSAKYMYVRYEGPAALSSPSSVAKKCRPDVVV